MRNLLLLLVLINALLLAWQRWIVAPPVADPYAPQGGGDLPALLAYQRPAAPVAPASKAAPQVARACVAVGPFANPVAARRAAQLLTQRGMQLRLEQREAEVWLGHWVQITGFASRAQAASALKRLIAAGLGDAYIVRDGRGERWDPAARGEGLRGWRRWPGGGEFPRMTGPRDCRAGVAQWVVQRFCKP